jgi:hypothetical protein
MAWAVHVWSYKETEHDLPGKFSYFPIFISRKLLLEFRMRIASKSHHLNGILST